MARQEIILGAAPNGFGGDPPRTASSKINAMSTELYARQALLGTASNATLTVGTSDITSGRVLKVGDYGFGVMQVFNDYGLDVLTSFGYCYINNGYSAPTGHRFGWLFSLPVSDSYVIQEFRSQTDGSVHTRAKLAGVWQAWRMTYNTGNTTRAADGTLTAI
ncbi:pyocin knob domain-containing protein [Pseudomonas sp. M5A4_2d]